MKPKPKPEPKPAPDETIDVAPDPERKKEAKLTYVTYTKKNPKTGEVYAGRARGYGTPDEIIAGRDRGHKDLNKAGFGPARLDESAEATLPLAQRYLDPAYQAIRGREQQLIDRFGGARSDARKAEKSTRSANAIRAVDATNPLGRTFHLAASLRFGQIARYTGK